MGSSSTSKIRVELRIEPFDPDWEQYELDAEPRDRILDLLHRVKWEIDGTLTFRRSCGHGVCGSDAMLINGRNRLACTASVDQLGRRISVSPLPALPVIKDLAVDMSASRELRMMLADGAGGLSIGERWHRTSPSRGVALDLHVDHSAKCK